MRASRAWLTACVLALTACAVNVDNPADHPDAPRGQRDAAVDSPLRADAATPDAARPCVGGDKRASDATGACFLFFQGPRTRGDAANECAANASHLAIVRSAAQNALVQTLVAGVDAFLGATDAVTEGAFLWPDGTSFTFTNFRAGEPNNGGGQFQEDCVVIEGTRGGSWDNRPCAPPPVGTGSLAYVCQF